MNPKDLQKHINALKKSGILKIDDRKKHFRLIMKYFKNLPIRQQRIRNSTNSLKVKSQNRKYQNYCRLEHLRLEGVEEILQTLQIHKEISED